MKQIEAKKVTEATIPIIPNPKPKSLKGKTRPQKAVKQKVYNNTP